MSEQLAQIVSEKGKTLIGQQALTIISLEAQVLLLTEENEALSRRIENGADKKNKSKEER